MLGTFDQKYAKISIVFCPFETFSKKFFGSPHCIVPDFFSLFCNTTHHVLLLLVTGGLLSRSLFKRNVRKCKFHRYSNEEKKLSHGKSYLVCEGKNTCFISVVKLTLVT